MSQNTTDRFIKELHDLSCEHYGEDTIHQAKRCLLDYLGAAFTGSHMLRQKSECLLEYFGALNGACRAIGFSHRVNIQHAAFLNGFSAHIAEMDDGYRFGAVHPGATIISALLPLTEKEKLNADDLLRGIIVGYEAALRISKTMQPSLKNRGYHATGVCGTIGSAIGVAATLGFSSKQMKDTISAASTGATGILKVIRDGSQLKPLNAAQAASTGLQAAFVARAGFEGPEDVLGGDKGFLEMKANEYNEACLFKNKDAKPGIHDIYVKPYAACRHSHPAVEAALNIKAAHNIEVPDIKEIRVSTYSWAVHMHDHVDISGINSGKMSTPYSVAVALADNQAGIDQFTMERINEPIVNALTKKVKVTANDELSAMVPNKRAAIVEVVTYNGQCYTKRIDLPKGEPENPLSEKELTEKFITLGTYGGKNKKELQKIIRCVWDLEKSLNSLITFL